MPKKVLVIDDDPNVVAILRLTLEWAGYEVVAANEGSEGLERVRDSRPDLILLDIMMPGMDGWQVCRQLRKVTDLPIIMLTVRGKEEEIAKGLQLGADDYLVKPWSNRELLARIRAVLRRVGTSSGALWHDTYSRGDVLLDPIRREVIVEDKRVNLTPTEFHLLAYLARRPGQVVPYSELLAQVWGTEFEQDIACLRWHMYNLRQKIEKDPQHPQYLLGRHGIGYYLADVEGK